MRKISSIRAQLPVLALCSAFLVAGSAGAENRDLAQAFKVNEDNPSANIPTEEQRNAAPLEFGYYLQDLYTRGELAFEKGEWATAAKYFEALAKLIPDRARSFSKLCESYTRLGQFSNAAARCGKAIGLRGASLFDHKWFVEASLAAPSLSPKAIGDIDASIAHVRAEVAKMPELTPPAAERLGPIPADAPAEEAGKRFAELKERQEERRAAVASNAQRASFVRDFELLACRLALRLRDAKRIDGCVSELRRQKLEERIVLPFEWSGALVRGDRPRAEALLARAKALGLPPRALGSMLDEQRRTFGLVAWLKRSWVALTVGLGALLACAGVLVFFVRRRRGHAVAPELGRSAAPAES